jgi:hypothetical protein
MPQAFSADGAAGAGDSLTNSYNSMSGGTPSNTAPGSQAITPGHFGYQAGNAYEDANGAMDTFQPSSGGGGFDVVGTMGSGGSSPSSAGSGSGAGGGLMPSAPKASDPGPISTPFTDIGAGLPSWNFAEGGDVSDSDGAIDTSDTQGTQDQGGGDSDGSPQQDKIAQALQSVSQVLDLNRSMYGLGGGQQMAGAMPTIPGTQSETGGGTYGPGGTPPPPQPQQQAGMMPTIPGNQSETPGPYVPQQPKPQQLAAAMPMIPGNQSNTPGPYQPGTPRPQQQSAIDTDEGTA